MSITNNITQLGMEFAYITPERFGMGGCFNSVKITSNAIVLRVDADDRFLDYLKNTVKKSFGAAILMRYSLFIFPREAERYRRKVFLTWVANLLSKELAKNKKTIYKKLYASCDLPINIQITPKTAVVAIRKAYAFFEKDTITIKCYSKEAPLFSYFRALLKNRCEIENALFELKIKSVSQSTILIIKSIFTKKLILGNESYQILFSKADFDRFCEAIKSQKFQTFDPTEAKRALLLSILGLEENVCGDVIKKRYFELAKKYHPDLHSDKSESEKAKYTKKFLEIKEAYEALKCLNL